MRSSALPIVSKCRGSYHLTQGHGSIHSRLGQAFHEAARAKVLDRPIDQQSLIARYALTDDEINGINYAVFNLVIQLPKDATILADDKKLEGFEGKVSGTPDLAVYNNKTATVADWKSGWGDVEDPETNNQILSYGIMFVEYLEREGRIVEKVVLLIVQPRLNKVKTIVLTREELMARKPDIMTIVVEAEDPQAPLTTGPWCASCFKSMHCPAFAGQVMSLAKFIAPGEPLTLERTLQVMLPIAKACATMGDKVLELAKVWVDQNGDLDLGDDQKFIKCVELRKEIDSEKALKILPEFFGESDITKLCKISWGAISELAVKTKRGLSTIVKGRLTADGAMKDKPITSYRIIKGGNGNGGTSDSE